MAPPMSRSARSSGAVVTFRRPASRTRVRGVGEQPSRWVDDTFPVAGAQLLVGLPVDVQRGGQPRVRPGADRLSQHRADPAEVGHRIVGGGETPVPDALCHGVDDQVGQRRPASGRSSSLATPDRRATSSMRRPE